MKGTLFLVAAISLLVAVPSLAADGGQAGQGSGMTFEQRKAEFLTRIDERIARLQETRGCVSAAATPEALRACLANRRGEAVQGHPKKGQQEAP